MTDSSFSRPSFPVVLVWGLLGVGLWQPGLVRGQSFVGTVRGVVDGDTVHFLRDTGQIVRMDLYGVDAPELGQSYGPAAAQALRRMVYDKRVRALAEGNDPDGRPLFVLRTDSDNVNAQLVRQGLAWWDRRRAASEDRLRRLEQRARVAEGGLWAQPDPVPPWRWRARQSGS